MVSSDDFLNELKKECEVHAVDVIYPDVLIVTGSRRYITDVIFQNVLEIPSQYAQDSLDTCIARMIHDESGSVENTLMRIFTLLSARYGQPEKDPVNPTIVHFRREENYISLRVKEHADSDVAKKEIAALQEWGRQHDFIFGSPQFPFHIFHVDKYVLSPYIGPNPLNGII